MSYYHHSHQYPDNEGMYPQYHPHHPHSHPPPPPPGPPPHPHHAPPAMPQEFYHQFASHNAPSSRRENGFSYYMEPGQVMYNTNKPGYNNRKDSADSGISDYSSGWNSRKTSSTSNASHASFCQEDLILEDVLEETPFDEPDQETCKQIVQQVEFYFSDANITKDKFLLKHIRRNKEGFVSIKLISSFKRVKHLTKDWRQVAFAIQTNSDKLEVNDQKTKVRRLDPLPEYDETTPSRTVVALNLPLERPTIESVAEIFSSCGDIVLVRILRPGNPIPADIKPFANKHPEMSDKVCALIEFECTEFALRAVRELNGEESSMTVMELISTPVKPVKKEEKKKGLKLHQPLPMPTSPGMPPTRRVSHAGFGQVPTNPDHNMFGPRGRKISLQHNIKFQDEYPVMQHPHQAQLSALNPNAPTFQMQQRRSREAAQSSSPPISNSQCPWMIRKLSCGVQNNSQQNNCGLTLPLNVIRMPRGPEKGKTFIRRVRKDAVAETANGIKDVKLESETAQNGLTEE